MDDPRYAESVDFLKSVGPDWARLIERVGPCRHDPKAAREPYEALVRSIAYQQLTARAGDAIIDRLKTRLGGHGFPSPKQLADADPDALRACGFSAAKAATIQAIAGAALSGFVPGRDAAAAMEDEALIDRLTAIRGIGRWTVEMLLIYSLERLDVLPADDFGAREGYRLLKALPAPPTPRALRGIASAWAPHRTVATWYLWRIPRDRAPAGT